MWGHLNTWKRIWSPFCSITERKSVMFQTRWFKVLHTDWNWHLQTINSIALQKHINLSHYKMIKTKKTIPLLIVLFLWNHIQSLNSRSLRTNSKQGGVGVTCGSRWKALCVKWTPPLKITNAFLTSHTRFWRFTCKAQLLPSLRYKAVPLLRKRSGFKRWCKERREVVRRAEQWVLTQLCFETERCSGSCECQSNPSRTDPHEPCKAKPSEESIHWLPVETEGRRRTLFELFPSPHK